MKQDPRQFDMFAAIDPPKPPERNLYEERQAAIAAWEPSNMVGRDQFGRPQVQTRAASHGGILTLYDPEGPEPFEVVVRGVPTVISFHGGFATHAIQPAGSPYWSETGYRSFCGGYENDPNWIVTELERFIDAPAKNGNGCGGRLRPWWPSYVLQWHQSLAFELMYAKDRSTVWDQWGPEKWEEHWHRHDMKLADAIQQMREEGIDPNDVGPPAHFKGKWPSFAPALL